MDKKSPNKIPVHGQTDKKDKINLIDLKIAVLGKTLVGKSALTYRFINDKFPTDHDTTIEDQYRVNVSLEGVDCRLEILDTAGQDDYQTMLDSWISYAEGFILVYAIDDKESFEGIRKRYERIVKNKGKNNPCVVVVGNKCDLVDRRKIETSEAEEMCKSLNVKFLEASALEKINVKEVFLIIAQDLLSKNGLLKGCQGDSEKKKRCYCF